MAVRHTRTMSLWGHVPVDAPSCLGDGQGADASLAQLLHVALDLLREKTHA